MISTSYLHYVLVAAHFFITDARLSSTSHFSESYFGKLAHNTKLKILLYESGDTGTSLQTFLDTAQMYGLDASVIGRGSAFNGFGSKYKQIRDTVVELNKDPENLIAILDSRDVVLNIKHNAKVQDVQQQITDFIESYNKLMLRKPNAVLISAEEQCCVSALCHASSPAAYFDPWTGQRVQRACSSGEDGCEWRDNENVMFWQSLMKEAAKNKENPYLNAGMMVGTAPNLLSLIDRMNLDEEEDDQAVLSAIYLQFPGLIALDFEQELLGNSAWSKGLEHGCFYDFDPNRPDQPFLINQKTGTAPLIIHTSGKFYDCLDSLIDKLGGESEKRHTQAETSRSLTWNYGRKSSRRGKGVKCGKGVKGCKREKCGKGVKGCKGVKSGKGKRGRGHWRKKDGRKGKKGGNDKPKGDKEDKKKEGRKKVNNKKRKRKGGTKVKVGQEMY